MLRTALWTLRQPRYAALGALMFVIALTCIGAGTWQISRFERTRHINDALQRNASAASVPLTTALAPLVGLRPAPSREAIRYRTVQVSGTYLATAPQYLRNQTVDGITGFYVLNPMRTASGVLLVARGFVADNGENTPPPVSAPPPGAVSVVGRLQTATTKSDAAAAAGHGELETVNPAEQAERLVEPVYNTYLTLNAGQPGSSGLGGLPAPDLSNPAGGAAEPQHFAYIIQWYLFALLALAAPFLISRSEIRDAQRQFLGIDPGNEEFGIEGSPRFGGPLALTDGPADSETSTGQVAIRPGAFVGRSTQPSAQQWQRAVNLADRYGRSLGAGRLGPRPVADRSRSVDPSEEPTTVVARPVTNSAIRPHRSEDAYHGSYNDYLWQLGLADGATPPVTPSTVEEEHSADDEGP